MAENAPSLFDHWATDCQICLAAFNAWQLKFANSDPPPALLRPTLCKLGKKLFDQTMPPWYGGGAEGNGRLQHGAWQNVPTPRSLDNEIDRMFREFQ